MQAATAAADIPDGVRTELQTMIDWTTHHAAYVDPLTDLDWRSASSRTLLGTMASETCRKRAASAYKTIENNLSDYRANQDLGFLLAR